LGRFEKLDPAAAPPARVDGALVEDPASGRLLLYGGADGVELDAAVRDDLWAFDGASWTRLETASAPPARRGALTAFDAERRHWIVFGGLAPGSMRDDLWRLDVAANQWSPLTAAFEGDAPPSGRAFGAAGWDAEDDLFVAFGGLGPDAQAALSDGWTLASH
jgi:hypothetical protein